MGEKNRLYNPFKMWGSYAGSLVSIIFIKGYGFTSCSIVEGDTSFWLVSLKPFIPCFLQIHNVGLIISIIIGFFLGWRIHSLFRSLK